MTEEHPDSLRARLAYAQGARLEAERRAATWKRVAKRVRSRAQSNEAALWRTIRKQIDTIRQMADERNAAEAEVRRLRAALEAIEAIESGRVTATRTAGDVARAALGEQP